MEERENIRRELRELGAERLLDAQGRKPTWKLSAAQLTDLAERAERAAAADGRPRPRRFIRYAAAAAAVAAFVLGCFIFTREAAAPPATVAGWDAISTEALQEYVDAHLEEFDLELLAAYATEPAALTPGEGISTEALENYLETEDGFLDAELPELIETTQEL